jgi:glucose-1-phosphate adenylyltransferase
MKDVLALILAGGRVDDMGVFTFFRPKSILPFGGLYRIIDFPMSNLMRSGIGRVGILSQYRPFHLMEHISNGAPWGMVGRKRFATILPPFKGMGESDWYKGTADAVYQNLDFIRLNKPDLILILSGDHVYRMDYRDIIEFHREKRADLTVAFTKVSREGAHRFGLGLIQDEDARGGRLLKYIEKPDQPAFDWASLTVYVFRPEILVEALEANARTSSHEFGRDIIPALLKQHRVYGFKHSGYWGYTRTPQEYWETSMDLLGNNPKLNIDPWAVVTNLAHRDIQDRQPALIGSSAIIKNSLLYSGCHIEGTAINSILFPGVEIDDGAVVKDSILFFDTKIGKNAKITRTIADNEVRTGRNVSVGDTHAGKLCIIGRGTDIPEDIAIPHGVTVFPNLGPGHFTGGHYKPGDIIQ